MADLMKKHSFLRSGENISTSYDWIDVSEGTGIVEYRGLIASTAAANYEYILTISSTLYSAKNGYELCPSGTNTFTFDATFNMPKYIKGTAHIYAPIYQNSAAAAKSVSNYILGRIYHYDGSTETAISSEITSETFTTASGAGTSYRNFVIKVPITTAKLFKKGDTLRIKLKVEATYGAGAGAYPTDYSSSLGISPIGQNSWSGTHSGCKFYIPFRIDE